VNADQIFMNRCLELAAQGKYYVAPNPMVGCVFVKDNMIVSEGYHRGFGMPHAEVDAFENLPNDINASECDIYVNLEPCSHFGKTPPCTELITKIRPNRIVIGAQDPNPLVSGKGIQHMVGAGITVVENILSDECMGLNKFFYSAYQNKVPFITLKWAETKDSFIGRLENDSSNRKISDQRNDAFVHDLRASHQAILVGAITLTQDNPLLNVRYSDGKDPIKIILSPNLSIDMEASTLKIGHTIVYNSKTSIKKDNVELVLLENFTLSNVLHDLYQRNIHSVLVEGGAKTLQHFIDLEYWDEIIKLKSSESWNDGVPAPHLSIEPNRKKKSFNDIISFYNRS